MKNHQHGPHIYLKDLPMFLSLMLVSILITVLFPCSSVPKTLQPPDQRGELIYNRYLTV